jgi:hypothetical protein
MTEKFVGYFRLVEACVQPGCPVCRCLLAESRSYLGALLHEQVTDPETRRALRRSRGFCNWHTWMLAEIEGVAFGTAILCEDLVGRAVRRIEPAARRARRGGVGRWLVALAGGGRPAAPRDDDEPRSPCSACVEAVRTEARYLETLVRFIDDEAVREAYASCDGLCVPHLGLVQDGPGDRARVSALTALTRQAWARIARDLAGFVGKHDHRNVEPCTDAEATSRARALEMLAGARGVFGTQRRG